MQIMIDTKHDSEEEIRKAIKLLEELITRENTSFVQDMPMNMFDTPAENPQTPEDTPPEKPDVQDKPHMEFY